MVARAPPALEFAEVVVGRGEAGVRVLQEGQHLRELGWCTETSDGVGNVDVIGVVRVREPDQVVDDRALAGVDERDECSVPERAWVVVCDDERQCLRSNAWFAVYPEEDEGVGDFVGFVAFELFAQRRDDSSGEESRQSPEREAAARQ